MEGAGVCTACGASDELNAEEKCPECAQEPMESEPQPELEDDQAMADDGEMEDEGTL